MSISTSGPAASGKGRFFDDFFVLGTAFPPKWSHLLGGAGAAALLIASLDADYDDGRGVLRHTAKVGGASAVTSVTDAASFNARSPMVFKSRFRTGAAPTDLSFSLGLSNGQNTVFATLTTNVNGNWFLDAVSNAGGGSVNLDTGVAVVDSVFHEVVISVVPGVSVTAYLNGVQIAQITTANAVPQDGDFNAPYMRTAIVAAGGFSYIDYVDVRVS